MEFGIFNDSIVNTVITLLELGLGSSDQGQQERARFPNHDTANVFKGAVHCYISRFTGIIYLTNYLLT